MFSHIINRFFHNVRIVNVLDCVPYDPAKATAVLERELDYRYYGRKHRESLFTKFYQCHILTDKFGVDKRRPHLSTLVCAGQLTRDEALAQIDEPAYAPDELDQDKRYVIKKLGLTNEAFDELMQRPIKEHRAYATDEWFFKLARRIGALVGPRIKERLS